MKARIFLIILVGFAIIGCSEEPKKTESRKSVDHEDQERKAKTSYGQAVEAAKGVNKLADKHNRALEEQAGE